MMRFRLLRNASLSTTVLLLVAGTFFSLILLVWFSVVWVTRRASERAFVRDFRVTDTFLFQTLGSRADSMQQVCRSLGSRPGVVLYLLPSRGGRDWATVSETAEEVREEVDAQNVLITDQAGRAIGESRRLPTDAGKRFSRLPGIAAALDGKAWQGVVPWNGKLSIAISVPIRTPGQPYVQGTISAFAEIGTPLAQLVAQVSGREIAFLRNHRFDGQSLPLDEVPELPDIRDGTTYTLPSPVISRGKRYRGFYQSIRMTPESAPLGVLLLRPDEDAMVLAHDIQAALIGPFAVAMLLALAAGAAVARRITLPLAGVVRAAREVREGRWPMLFDVERGDEIGLLQTVFNEMTMALRVSQDRMLALIDTDPLTEMDNHRRFQDRLAQEMERAQESGESLSLLVLDIDNFQDFNLKFGHRRGDEALKGIAKRLRALLPAYAIAARYGGEEFAILAPRYTSDEVAALAEEIRAAISDSAIGVTASIGFAETQGGIAGPDSLTLAAEIALTQAKQLGRNRVCGFDALARVPGSDGSDEVPVDTLHLHRFLHDGNLATVQALAAAVDAKDPYTHGHSRRVADLAVKTAKHYGLSKSEIELLFIVATLHDVGKIGVPDRVLQKPGKLDPEERSLIETHPVLGELIVGKLPQLARALPGIRSHHERWDGGGYPDGLAGEQIPVVARILALADTYDAMTSDRPYRSGLSQDVALREILSCSGAQFDPDLALVFVEAAHEGRLVGVGEAGRGYPINSAPIVSSRNGVPFSTE